MALRHALYSVSALQTEAAENGVDAGGCVDDECEVVRPGAKEIPQNGARLIELPEIVVVEEHQRFALDPTSNAGLLVEHGLRSRTKRPVIEENDLRVEQPTIGKMVLRRHPDPGKHHTLRCGLE
jgi:hypothetical protein